MKSAINHAVSRVKLPPCEATSVSRSKPPKPIKFLKSIPVVLRKPRLDTTANADTATTPGTCAGAARLVLQPQQHLYLGKFAETAESTHHIQAPSPLAQASVRSPFTLRKEQTRKLLVPVGMTASTTR